MVPLDPLLEVLLVSRLYDTLILSSAKWRIGNLVGQIVGCSCRQGGRINCQPIHKNLNRTDQSMGFIDELLIILTTGLLAGILCRRWSLTPLMGYLAVGVLIGPHFLGWVGEEEKEIEHLAELGVFFLLFSIGLEMSMDELKRMSRYLVTGGHCN